MLVTKLLNADMERSLGPQGLTMTRAQVLWELGGQPGMTQKMLADRLGVTPRNVTTLIDALEATGFVARMPHPDDRRATQLALTDKGAEFHRQFLEGKTMFSTFLFADVSRERLDLLRSELAKVISKLEALARSQSQ